jgi:hypothetical protein
MTTNYKGNFIKDRVVKSLGIVRSPSLNLQLKLYSIAETGKTVEENLIKNTKEFLIETSLAEEKKWGSNNYKFGFAMLSLGGFNAANRLNVAKWSEYLQGKLENKIYGFNEDINSAHNLDLNRESSFDIWELPIASYEGELWEEYLQPGSDGKMYLIKKFTDQKNI